MHRDKPLIIVQNAEFSYDGHAVVSGLDFAVRRGDYICVVGENGSGKSTLVRGLLRLKVPSGGSILFNIAASGVGYLPQQTSRDFPASAFEVVISGCLPSLGWRPFYTKSHRETARTSMERMGAWDLRGRCFSELSGGEAQRVLLARALCASQTLLILDEPVSGLDPAMTSELYRLVGSLNDSGMAVVMVSHDTAAVSEAAKVLHLANRQLFFGSAADYALSDTARRFLTGG